MMFSLLRLVFILVSVLGFATPVRAECALVTVAYRQSAPAVFSGTAQSVENVTDQNAPGYQVVTFQVDRVWKGNVKREETFYNVLNVEGEVIVQGAGYLIFGQRFDAQRDFHAELPPGAAKGFVTGPCGDATPIDTATKRGMIRELGNAAAPK